MVVFMKKMKETQVQKSPFKLIYNNDGTNVLNCISPFNGRDEEFSYIKPFQADGKNFRPQMIEASVDEIADTGVDASLFSPGLGWVPWWPSKVCPDHYKWYETQTGELIKGGGIEYFVRHGGDMVKPFVNRCRRHQIAPFITFRLNDGHFVGIRGLDEYKPRFYVEHPEYQLSPNGTQNWRFHQVREYKLALITELLENYDLDGIELDFMRHWSFFNTGETTSNERKAIMTEFVGCVRSVLDQTAKDGRHRWLCVRVPIFLSKHDAMGIDLVTWVNQCGLEMVNLSASYLTHQEGDLPKIRRMVPDVAIYQECTQATITATMPHPEPNKPDQFHYRRTTDEEFYTTAYLAYKQGADGISLFNFAYYREHGAPLRGTFCEPPFHVLKSLTDKNWLSQQQALHYFLGSTTNDASAVDFQLERKISKGQIQKLTMQMSPPEGINGLKFYFRIHTRHSSENLYWTVLLNNVELVPHQLDGEPIEQPYDGLLGEANQQTGFIGDPEIVLEGENVLEIKLISGGPIDVIRIDLVFI